MRAMMDASMKEISCSRVKNNFIDKLSFHTIILLYAQVNDDIKYYRSTVLFYCDTSGKEDEVAYRLRVHKP